MRNLILILLIALIAVALGTMLFGESDEEDTEYTISEAREVAVNWMEENSPTYTHDGSDLEVVEEEEISDNVFEFIFEFESSSAGYGDRSDEMTAQVITSHTTKVVVEEDEVTSAITDESYSELDDEMIEDDTSGDEASEEEVSLFFVLVEDGVEEVTPVSRSVTVEDRVERAALKALLEGLTEEEIEEGYSTAINDGVEILDLEIDEGVASVDFSSELDEEVAGSATVTAIRDQIEKTLEQFDTVDEVSISVEGESEGILQP
ncbi:MAG: GerMN domain-containing protein [Candidatus Paceibacterota bacterium]